MNENVFRILGAIILVAGVGMSVYFRRKADRDTGEKVSTKDEAKPIYLALRLGGLVIWFSLIAYFINPAWMSWSTVAVPAWLRWFGVGLGVVCLGLIYWVFSSLGTGITPTVATRREHRMVTTGPYRWVRHPFYTVTTTFFLALAMLAGNWFIAVLTVLAFILLAIRTSNEEAHLIAKFGDQYRQYMSRTGRFLPRLF